MNGLECVQVQKFTILALILSAVSIASSFPIAYLAYFGSGSAAVTLYEVLSSLMFWVPVVSLSLWFPLKNATFLFAKHIRAVRGKLLFVSYVTIHLVLYGLLLETILHYAYKLPELIAQPSAYFNVPFYPASPWAIITSIGFYPNVSMLVPPAFDFVWSFYSIVLALVIGMLVVTNVMQLDELGKICPTPQRTRSFLLLPVLGVTMGATCCLSFPLLVSLAGEFSKVIPNSLAAFVTAYFLLPLTAAIVLKYNMDSTSRVANDIQRLETSLKSVISRR